jgi:hypothetical protein
VLRIPIPFPSIGDVFFLAAYPLYIAALIAFLRAYEVAGYPVGTPAERWRVGLGMAAACAVLAVVTLRPVVQATSPGLEKFLNTAYPVLDFVVLHPRRAPAARHVAVPRGRGRTDPARDPRGFRLLVPGRHPSSRTWPG